MVDESPADAARPPSRTTRLTGYLGVVGAVLGLVGTGVGIWTQIEGRRQQRELDGLKIEVERLEAQREDRKLDYDIALKIYEKVVGVDEADARQLRLAVALIEVLPDNGFKGRLATALATLSSGVADATDDQELREDARKVAQAADFIAQSHPPVRAAPPASETVAAGRPGGWDYDVFWCESLGAAADPGGANPYQAAAQAVAAWLGTPDAGRVRVRMLPDAVNARPGYQISGNVIRADPKSEETARAAEVKRGLEETGRSFRIETAGGTTPWYISLFVCPESGR